jgi:probable F420-dependent oxidoreductase
MRFGVRLPGAGPLATPDGIAAFARKAEEVGFDSLWMPNHVALPVRVDTRYPYREDGKFFWAPEAPYLDTILALTWASAATTRIQVGPSALVTAWHPPVNMAKELATLDFLNGGRTLLVVAAGWMKEQFDILGVPFSERGARCTEYVRLLKHLWTADTIDFHGRFFQFSGFKFYPKPVRKPSLPVWIGGKSDGSLRRVAAVGDGWHPLYLTPEEMGTKLEVLKGYLEEEGRSLDEVELSARPVTQAPMDLDTVERFAALGVRTVVWDPDFEHDRMDAVLGDLERMAERLLVPAAGA